LCLFIAGHTSAAYDDDAYAPACIARLQPELQGREVWLLSSAWHLATVMHVDMAQQHMWVQHQEGGGPRCLAGPELQHLLSHGHLALATPGPLVQQQASSQPGGVKRPRSPDPPGYKDKRAVNCSGRDSPAAAAAAAAGAAARGAYPAGVAPAVPAGYGPPPYPYPGKHPAWHTWDHAAAAAAAARQGYPSGPPHAPHSWGSHHPAGLEPVAWWQPYYPIRQPAAHEGPPPGYNYPSPHGAYSEYYPPQVAAAGDSLAAAAGPVPREAHTSSSSRHLSSPGSDSGLAAPHRQEPGQYEPQPEPGYNHRQPAGAAAGPAIPAPGPGLGVYIRPWLPGHHASPHHHGLPPAARPAMAAPLPAGLTRPMHHEPLQAWAFR
jgi:hypothetical protein